MKEVYVCVNKDVDTTIIVVHLVCSMYLALFSNFVDGVMLC